jgi:hypothetical protein
MRAVRRAAIGGDVVVPLLACAGLTLLYGALAVVLLRQFERHARDRATLSLS